jgi:hypothetical protein
MQIKVDTNKGGLLSQCNVGYLNTTCCTDSKVLLILYIAQEGKETHISLPRIPHTPSPANQQSVGFLWEVTVVICWLKKMQLIYT